MKPDYIEFRVPIHNSSNIDLLQKIASEMQDLANDYIEDSCIAYGNGFTDIKEVLQSGDVTYEFHLADE